MPQHILTDVSATVDPSREAELVAGFRELTTGPTPDGLLRTELLQGPGNHWRVQTLWLDQASLDAMRGGSEPPAAPRLFRAVGAEPVLEVLVVAADHLGPATDR